MAAAYKRDGKLGTIALTERGEASKRARNVQQISDKSRALKFEDKDLIFDEKKWPWLKEVSFAEKRMSEGGGERVMGYANGFLVDREAIRADFLAKMAGSYPGLALLAFGLFDQHGDLKEQHYRHELQRGNGVWGPELNQGSVFLFQQVGVHGGSRRQGLEARLVGALWRKVRIMDPSCHFAFALAAVLGVGDQAADTEKLATKEGFDHEVNKCAVSVAFWRMLGFRRVGTTDCFGFAADMRHKSHEISANLDFNRPRMTFPLHVSPLHGIVSKDGTFERVEEGDTRSFLEMWLKNHPWKHASWREINGHGNTILHSAAEPKKLDTLKWLLGQGFARELLNHRNNELKTPAEVFESNLESARTQKIARGVVVYRADRFRGHSEELIKCLFQLKGQPSPSISEFERAVYGCTCGKCCAYLSPRSMRTLADEAEYLSAEMDETWSHGSALSWYSRWCSKLHYMKPHVQHLLRSDIDMQCAFADLVRYVTNCDKAKTIPCHHGFFGTMRTMEAETSTRVCKFLGRGGMVGSAVLACLDAAMQRDKYTGNGATDDDTDNDLKRLPKCRNDHEWQMARREFARKEGMLYFL